MTRLFPHLSTEKEVTSHDTLVAMSTPSFQTLGPNITPTKEPGFFSERVQSRPRAERVQVKLDHLVPLE